MNAQQNTPISDRFSSLCARVFSPAAAILESEKTLGTRLEDLVRAVRPGLTAVGPFMFHVCNIFSLHVQFLICMSYF